jgi:rubrerythrin
MGFFYQSKTEGSELMKLDVYVCNQCEEEFAVKENADVVVCPICARPDLEFSHEADLLEVK